MRFFTDFEQQEHVDDFAGKLESDLIRTRAILDRITSRSLVIMNKSHSSTSLEDRGFWDARHSVGSSTPARLCMYVTFIDQLSRLVRLPRAWSAPSMPPIRSIRTFRVVRMVADGKASVEAIAEKHGLAYDQLLGQIDEGAPDVRRRRLRPRRRAAATRSNPTWTSDSTRCLSQWRAGTSILRRCQDAVLPSSPTITRVGDRQLVLADCLDNPEMARAVYAIAESA